MEQSEHASLRHLGLKQGFWGKKLQIYNLKFFKLGIKIRRYGKKFENSGKN